MLQYDPSKRISASESLEHSYFDDLKEELKKKEAISGGKVEEKKRY